MRNVLLLYNFIWINKDWVFPALVADALQFLKDMAYAFKFHSVFICAPAVGGKTSWLNILTISWFFSSSKLYQKQENYV